MRRRPFSTLLLTCTVFAKPALVTAQAQPTCESLRNLRLDRATVTSATTVASAPLTTPPNAYFKLPPATVPEHCEVKGVARPTSDSEIHFELWLPPPEQWNGKYLQHGNGGWAGSIPSYGLVTPVARGYAASATDDGHTAGTIPDASFAVGHPEKLIDFGFRAVHETAVHSKAIIRAYYGKEHTQDYFVGCSDGGREALMEAQRYPEDFRGIIAGAPANNWTRHFTGFIWNELALNADPASKIPAAALPAIQKAALSACDTLDGVKDGLIEDPRLCHFDASVLKCGDSTPGKDCLTQPQIDALRKIYEGPKSPKTGEQIYPGYEPGTEADAAGWSVWILGPIQNMFGNSFYSGAVFENPKWDWRTIDLDRDLKIAHEKTGWILNSYNPDLRSFRANGGKLIQYHGWGDAAIAPRDSIAYYEKVKQFLSQYPDPRSGSPKPIQDFYRLFMVPGMGHCAAGSGPNNFGNGEVANPSEWPQDADHDVVLALDRWVTQGVPPDVIIGSGKIDGAPMTRPLCTYPKVARHRGQGDTNDARTFECVE